MILGELFERSWKMIINPPKIPHRMSALGPREQTLEGKLIKRLDLNILNDNGVNISAMIIYCPDIPSPDLVLYLHGNGGSKIEALELTKCVPRFQFAVASFDFVGCGNSGDDYLTYGIQEVYDVKKVLNEVKKHIPYRKLTLWGRSMGAATSILFAESFPNQVSSLVLDAPFKSLDGLIKRAAYLQSSLPKSLINVFLYFVKKKCEDETKLNIFQTNYLEEFKQLHNGLSILFIFSRRDRIVLASQVHEFYDAFKGKKERCEIYVDHQQDRNQVTFIEGIKWIKRSNGNSDRVKRLDMLIRQGDLTSQKQNCNC